MYNPCDTTLNVKVMRLLLVAPAFLACSKISRQQFVADTAALLAGCDEQLRQKPEVATHPTQGEADDVTICLGRPHAVGIILQGKQLEIGGTQGGHGPKTVTLGQVVDTPNDERFRSL